MHRNVNGAVLFGVLAFALILTLPTIATGIRLATSPFINYPTNPFYNPGPCATCTTSFHYIVNGYSSLQTQTSPVGGCGGVCNGLFGVSAGTLYDPVGMLGEAVTYTDSQGILPSAALALWSVKLPSSIPDACVAGLGSGACLDQRGFDLSGTVTGANGGILLTSAAPVGDPTCTNYSGQSPDKTNVPANSCWAADYAIVQAAQTANPPCIAGVTECLSSRNTVVLNTTSVTGPPPTGFGCPGGAASCTYTKATNQTTVKTWYIYREITSLALQIAAPSVVPLCSPKFTGSQNVCLGNVNQCGLFGVGYCNPMPTLVGALPGFVSDMNKVSLLSGTRVSFGIGVTGFAGLTCSPADVASGNCWYGIVGVWIGGQSFQTSGCSATNSCVFVQGQHTQLPIFQDAGLALPAAVPSVDTLVNLAAITNQTIQAVTQQNTYGQVMTYVDAQSLGPQYAATPSTCTLGTLNNCITTPLPIVVNVPLVYDIIGGRSLANWLTYYPGLPPSGGPNAGSVLGTVTDSSTNAPIVGACVGVNGVCSGYAGQLQTTTDSKGKFTFSNVPPGTYSLWTNPAGYNLGYASGVQVVVGGQATANIVVNPLPNVGAGMLCLIPPLALPNPVPFQPPILTPGVLCVPQWVIPASFIIAGLVVVAVIFTTPAGSAFGMVAASYLPRGKKTR